MTILYASSTPAAARWIAELQSHFPDDRIEQWPDVSDPSAVEFVVCWDFDLASTADFDHLRGVLVAGAGVSHLDLDALAPEVPVVRLIDPAVADDMATYALQWVLYFQKDMHRYASQQAERTYRRHVPRRTSEFTVGVLGMGNIGTVTADLLVASGFAVVGWSRTAKRIDGVEMFSGEDGLGEAMQRCDAVINVLPLTPSTHQCLDASALAQLRPGGFVINMGRAGTIDDDALFAALDAGTVGGAVLDVVRGEPLDADAPIWDQRGLIITPHISGFTHPDTAVALMADNIRRIRAGEAPYPVVDRSVGY